MPRKSGRGGHREGQIGKAYPNRSDLNEVTGLPYGEKQKLEQAQAALPAAQPQPPAPQPAAPTPFAQSQAAAAQALAGHQPSTIPIPLTVPSQRPGEHVMTSPTQPAAVQPLLAATASLNALGGKVSPQAAALRAALNARQANQAAL